MSANRESGSNKASGISSGSAGLMTAVITGMNLLRMGRLCSLLGIAGFVLPLVFKNSRLIRAILKAADRRANRTRPERKQGV